jgi:hypothetical protein
LSLLLPDVLLSEEPLAPIEVLPLVDGSPLAVLPVVPVVPLLEPVVLSLALGLVVLPLVLGEAPIVELLLDPGVGVVTPPVPALLEPEAPDAPDEPDAPDAPDEPDEPDAPEPEPAPPEPWAIDSPPIARAAAAAKAVRVFLVVIMTYSLSGNPEGGG